MGTTRLTPRASGLAYDAPIADWFYKATNSKLDHVGTMLLAKRGFLCRSAYTEKLALVPNVRNVQFGDTIHFYFIGKKGPRGLGAFKVLRKDEWMATKNGPALGDIGEPVWGTSLYMIENPDFIGAVDKESPPAYQPDPKLGSFTGWLIRQTGDARAASEDFLGKRATLVSA